MRRALTLPLAIDIGATRVRIVLSRLRHGALFIARRAARDVTDGTSAGNAIAEAWKELETTERRCVFALGTPHAELRCEQLKKGWQGTSSVATSSQDRVLRRHTIDKKKALHAVGTVDRKFLQKVLAIIADSGLQAIAADHEAFALARALPDYDVIIDIGHRRTSVHRFGFPVPRTLSISIGGAGITSQIMDDLAIDAHSAEARKRIHGATGAGEAAADSLLRMLSGAISSCRRDKPVHRVALVGNGARLRGLADGLRAASGCEVSIPESPLFGGNPTSGTDWNLAGGLSTWAA